MALPLFLDRRDAGDEAFVELGTVSPKDRTPRAPGLEGEAANDGGANEASAESAMIASRNEVECEILVPNGGYGWVCVACVFFLNSHTWGINSGYGIFLAYYLNTDAFPGATSLEYAFIAGLSVSQSLLLSPLITTISRLYSTRTTLIIGVVLQTAALIGASFATQIWHLFLSQGLCFGWGMGFLIVGSAGIIPQWFSTRRSLAQGIAAAGVGVGGLIYNLATNGMIQRLGLEWTWRILALISCVVNLICTLLIRDRNKFILPSQHAFDFRLFQRPEFLLILGWGFFSELGYVVLWFSLPAYAVSVGLSAQQGSVVGALLNLGTVIGRPIIGHLSDTMGRINMATLMTAWCGIICLVLWIFAKSFGLLCFFAILAGMVCGTFWSTIAPVGAEVVGLGELPSALSIVFLMMVLPSTFSEAIALKMRRQTGEIFLDTQLFTGFMFVAATVCVLTLRSWKILKLESDAVEKRRREAPDIQRGTGNGQQTKAMSTIPLLAIGKAFAVWKRV